MQSIRVMIWNLQDLGQPGDFKGPWAALAQFVAATAAVAQADVIMIQELRASAIAFNVLQNIQVALNALPPPLNNWYYDWIKGGLSLNAAAPYATSNDTDWDAGHHEGYAVFWNQNIAKFLMSPAAPVTAPGGGMTPNTQSEQVRMQVPLMAAGAIMALPGLAVPANGIVTPGTATPYTVPAGTTQPGGPAFGVATPVAVGTVLPVGTLVGAGGVRVDAPVLGTDPVVVPGGYTLTEALTLPAAGAVLVPQNALGLAVTGRNTQGSTYLGDISGPTTADFNPAAPAFDWINFTRGAGYPAAFLGPRRPAFVTIDVNRAAPNNTAPDRLVPIIAYHAPAAASASASGMQRASYVQPVYQAFDWGAPGGGAWVNCNNAMLGGDFNVVLDEVAYAYDAFRLPWASGGANMLKAVYAPPPPGVAPAPAPGDIVANQSMVAIETWGGGAAIFSANPDAFRARAIDNIFFRGLGAAMGAGALMDLPAAVSMGGALVGPPLTGFLAVPALQAIYNAMALGAPVVPGPLVAGPSTVADLLAGAMGWAPGGGNNTAARRAAELVRLCVSDHLPAAIQATL